MSSALHSQAAIDRARAALEADEGAAVGAHVAAVTEDECAVAHYFEADLPAYRGWQWCAVLAASPGGEMTVSETALLPGPGALTAPEFVPWDRRVQAGDLAPGDLLPPAVDDPRIEPGYLLTGDPEADEVAGEIGVNLERVMTRLGREEAAARWFDSDFGPEAEMARGTRFHCGDCAFYLPLAGMLGAAFGVCGNEYAADGRVVHAHYGCGAHSSTAPPSGAGSPAYEPYDDGAVESHELVHPVALTAVDEIELGVPQDALRSV
ncbi:DUF3027 domain-containing protein [Tsukamurella soli]|uniref:DUF3027 domain-containing protein n=1 Tax=Tsukamurella soli TaxID=644556 RepID=UPI0031E6BDBA